MKTIVFMEGIFIGFFICAPFGPIGLLCLRRTLTDGKIAGILSVLGTSTVDALYCSMAGLGIAFIPHVLAKEKAVIQTLLSLILLLLGASIFFSKKSISTHTNHGKGTLFGAFSSTFLLSLANPLLIIVFITSLSVMGIQGWSNAPFSMALAVLGVFLGSALWAAILAIGTTVFTKNITEDRLGMVNRICGSLIAVFGVILGFSTLLQQAIK